MIRSVLTLAERPIYGRDDSASEIEKLDISQSREEQNAQLKKIHRIAVCGLSVKQV